MALLAFGRERALNFFRRTSSHEHASPAELNADTAIPTHHPNTREANPIQGPKLYSKALKMLARVLLKNSARFLS